MSSELLRDINAIATIRAPGINANFIRVNLRLNKLTILVGPNASGKTTVLQTIGYFLSSLLEPVSGSLGIALTKTLRPTGDIPRLISGILTLNGTKIRNLIITPQPRLQLLASPMPELLYEAVNILELNQDTRYKLLSEIDNDMSKYDKSVLQAEEKLQEINRIKEIEGRKKIVHRRGSLFYLLQEFVKEILGENVQKAISDPLSGVKALEDDEYESNEFLMYLLRGEKEKIRLSYILTDNSEKIAKMILVGTGRATAIVFKAIKEASEFLGKTPSVMVFHPGFIFSTGIFERLYSYYAREGLPREEEAIELLREYIKWVKGYELYGHRLSLKAIDNRRVSVYNLSDGHRIAVFMSLIYALSRESTVFLIDTPEAFVHPDGLSIIADFISRLVTNGNQVLVATQSIEFLKKLLLSSKYRGIIDNTLVERIDMSTNGVIRSTGLWSGEVSLKSIDKLGLDLRR